MISKELLSEVLDVKVIKLGRRLKVTSLFNLSDRFEFYYYDGSDKIHDILNIHELAHKCKKWAWEQGYVINSHYANDYCYARANNMEDFSIDGKGNTEPEAVFKACQWVLDNKELICTQK